MDASPDQARKWLRCHRLDIEPTALVAARVRARRLAAVAEIATIAAGTAGLLVLLFMVDIDLAVWQVGLTVVLVVGAMVGLATQRWLERPLLAGRITRSAHPAAPDLVRIAGRAHLAEAAAVFGGGLLLGAVLAVLAPPGTTRSLALVFLAVVAVLTGLAAVGLAAVVRRPALAEDRDSLLVDDALRAEDARRVLLPYPLLAAFYLGIGSASVTSIALLVYAVAGGVGWYRADRSVRCAMARQPVAP